LSGGWLRRPSALSVIFLGESGLSTAVVAIEVGQHDSIEMCQVARSDLGLSVVTSGCVERVGVHYRGS
jgi:hypothetical protein